MQQYYLRPKTFVCIVDNHCVFLDLHKDKYLCLEPHQTNTLRALLGEIEHVGNENEINKLSNELLNHGLITKNPSQGKNYSAPNFANPTRDLMGYDVNKKPTIRLSHVLRFFTAATFSAIRLRWKPLEKVVRKVELRKLRHEQKGMSKNVDPEQLKELVEVFNRLRPLLFTATNQCLYDALSMIEFLAGYRIYPDWVFGIRMGPFSAHCWVQKDNIVLNDSVAKILLRTPIMVV